MKSSLTVKSLYSNLFINMTGIPFTIKFPLDFSIPLKFSHFTPIFLYPTKKKRIFVVYCRSVVTVS